VISEDSRGLFNSHLQLDLRSSLGIWGMSKTPLNQSGCKSPSMFSWSKPTKKNTISRMDAELRIGPHTNSIKLRCELTLHWYVQLASINTSADISLPSFLIRLHLGFDFFGVFRCVSSEFRALFRPNLATWLEAAIYHTKLAYPKEPERKWSFHNFFTPDVTNWCCWFLAVLECIMTSPWHLHVCQWTLISRTLNANPRSTGIV